MYEEFCTWCHRLVSLLFDDLSGHSYPFTFLMFLNFLSAYNYHADTVLPVFFHGFLNRLHQAFHEFNFLNNVGLMH